MKNRGHVPEPAEGLKTDGAFRTTPLWEHTGIQKEVLSISAQKACETYRVYIGHKCIYISV